MFSSILDDLKNTFRSGNMLSKIILVNVIVFVVINILLVFDFDSATNPSSFANVIVDKLAVVSSPLALLKQFWSIITHMFLHIGFWHIFWNMLLLLWFGRIVGDFIGDRRVLPLYILGGLFGMISYMFYDQLLSSGITPAYGASAAVMCMVMVSAMLSPDYLLHLILIGPVKLKYVALTILFLDIIGAGGMVNTGGHFGHLGGAMFGIIYVVLLRKGTDLTDPLQSIFGKAADFNQKPKRRKTPKKTFKVYKNDQQSDNQNRPQKSKSEQDELDRILDKINAAGYDKLTAEEKEFLYQASKKKK